MIGIEKNSGFNGEFLDYFKTYIIGLATIFTEAIRRLPHSVIFLDEFGKYHPNGSNILLQMSEGRILNDGKDRTTVNLKKCCPCYDE